MTAEGRAETFAAGLLASGRVHYGFPDPAAPEAIAAVADRERRTLPSWVTALAVVDALPPDDGLVPYLARAAQAAARVDRYRELAARLRGMDGVILSKGMGFVDLWPRAITRYTGDLDAAVPCAPKLWRAARELGSEGFEPVALTVFRSSRGLEALAQLERATGGPPDVVELSTAVWLGNRLSSPPSPRVDALERHDPARHLLLLAAERFDRRFELRDYVDVILLLEAAPDALHQAAEAAAELGAGRQLRSLVRAAARLPLAPEELRRRVAKLPPRGRAEPRAGARAAAAALRRRPLAQALQFVFVTRSRRAPVAWALTRTTSRISGRAAVESGLLAFGAPLPGAAGDVAWRDDHVLETPVGPFLLVAGPEIPEPLAGRYGLCA